MPNEATTIFTEVKPWLESAYFVSQIIVMFLVAYGLRQIQLTKNQIETTKNIFKTQSKRASVEVAVVECRRYAETILKDRQDLSNYCKSNSITYFDDVKFTRLEDGFSVDISRTNKDDLKKMTEASWELVQRIFNGLEAYSLFFLSGVADENIAFHSNAKSYIEVSETVFKLFPLLKIEDDDLEPVKELYLMWRKKYEAKKLSIEQKEIQEKLLTYNVRDIKPIGT
jgi:hypothetical protein